MKQILSGNCITDSVLSATLIASREMIARGGVPPETPHLPHPPKPCRTAARRGRARRHDLSDAVEQGPSAAAGDALPSGLDLLPGAEAEGVDMGRPLPGARRGPWRETPRADRPSRPLAARPAHRPSASGPLRRRAARRDGLSALLGARGTVHPRTAQGSVPREELAKALGAAAVLRVRGANVWATNVQPPGTNVRATRGARFARSTATISLSRRTRPRRQRADPRWAALLRRFRRGPDGQAV